MSTVREIILFRENLLLVYFRAHNIFCEYTLSPNYIVYQKTTLTLHTNVNAHQPILVIFGWDVAQRVGPMLSNGDLLSHLS